MIDFYNGQVTDLINNKLKYSPEVIAISYAIQQEKQRIMRLADKTRLISGIDSLEDWTLDYLAVELRTPAYRQNYPIEIKRKLIAGTIPFYAHLGTPYAVNLVINAIFSGGHVEEWFEYGGQPHHFRVFIDLTERKTQPHETEEMRLLIDNTKRLSSRLDKVQYIADIKNPDVLQIGGTFSTTIALSVSEQTDDLNFRHKTSAGGSAGLSALVPIPLEPENIQLTGKAATGSNCLLISAATVTELKEKQDK